MNRKIERTITIAATPERVYQAWVEEMNQWWTKPYYNDHERIHGLVMEPKLGGRYIEKWDENGGGFLIGTVSNGCLLYVSPTPGANASGQASAHSSALSLHRTKKVARA